MKTWVEVSGTVASVVYQNTENGYCIFEMSTPGDEIDLDEVVCTGVMPGIAAGENVRVTGSFVVHPTYGRQLAVETCTQMMPDTEAGLEKYLGSGTIKGVREKLARKIVGKFGKDTLLIIEEHPEKLTAIKGISMEKAMGISAAFHEKTAERRTIMALQSLGISMLFAAKIYKKYKENTLARVQGNPYALTDDIFGIGFKIADSIAAKAGIGRDAAFRVEAGIKYTLNEAAGNGHVYLPKTVLLEQAADILALPAELIENSLAKLQMDRVIWQEKIEETTVVYLHGYYYAENNVAKKLVELSANVVKKGRIALREIEAAEAANRITLADKQKEAVIGALEHGVLIMTGGPGTGKTTTINTIISILQKDDCAIELAAPTGRAAKRMSEATGMEAKTIHRLLEISFSDDSKRHQTFGKNKDNPLEADVVIIDESSMVDIVLMNSLLSALVAGTRLILVGDVDQLPSVGAGNVLKDIITSGRLPVVRLDEIFRQAQESAIIMNAHRINKGEYPILNEKSKDFFFSKKTDSGEVIHTLMDLVAKRLPAYADCDPVVDIQVLSPMRKSPLGVTHLNLVLQQKLNPPHSRKQEKAFRNGVFREGDKVMQIKNNYNMVWHATDSADEGLGVFNGDTGIIRNINAYDEVISVVFDDNKRIDYDFAQLDELELAYAMTIHKSQGSEYKVVVMPIHSGPPMLMSRNLLYTGVTRAKELCVIVGIPETLHRMIDNKREISRYSSLDRRIIKMQELFADVIPSCNQNATNEVRESF